jgi:DNA-binding protein HU-beta
MRAVKNGSTVVGSDHKWTVAETTFMIQLDIVNEVSQLADITKVKAELAVDAVFEAMRASMLRGERIELRGFGVFQVKPRKRGIGRNPRTGEPMTIKASTQPKFKAGKGLKDSCN